VIADISRFILKRKPLWQEYEQLLKSMDDKNSPRLDLQQVKRLRTLHELVAADLMRVRTFAAAPDTVEYLETLLAHGLSAIHGQDGQQRRFAIKAFLGNFAKAIRGHTKSMRIVLIAFITGCLVGAGAIALDKDAKEVIMPFPHLLMQPSERVALEEDDAGGMHDLHASFSAELMTHNIRVALFAMALGILFGVFTVIVVFYNGVILGAVAMDYILDGQTVFLIGWLLPHGSIEIPAILIAAQAGLIIAHTAMVRENRQTIASRFRRKAPVLATLIGGVALMLVWAGIIESFFSQYHEPTIPYSVKILFGVIQLAGLFGFIFIAGRKAKEVASQ